MGAMAPLARRALAMAAATTLAALVRTAEASPSAKLVYVRGTGADACPGEDELRKAVATRIGYDPFFPTAQKTVIAQVTRTSGGYHGKVQIVGDDGKVRGERDLASKGDDCAELVSTMALAVSIALDDLDEDVHPSAPTPAAPEPVPPPRAEVTRVEPRPEAPPRPPAPAAPAGPRLELGASAGPTISIGTAPALAVGASVAATLGYGAVGARLELRGELPSSGSLGATGVVSTSTILAALSGCVRGKVPFGCLGAGLGSLSSKTEGIARPASDSGRLVVLLASAGADVALGRTLYLEPFLEGALNLTPHHVEVDGSRAFSVPIVAGTVGLHLGGHFL
jgi:hypothetical protein